MVGKLPPNHPFVHRVWNIIFTIHFGGFPTILGNPFRVMKWWLLSLKMHTLNNTERTSLEPSVHEMVRLAWKWYMKPISVSFFTEPWAYTIICSWNHLLAIDKHQFKSQLVPDFCYNHLPVEHMQTHLLFCNLQYTFVGNMMPTRSPILSNTLECEVPHDYFTVHPLGSKILENNRLRSAKSGFSAATTTEQRLWPFWFLLWWLLFHPFAPRSADNKRPIVANFSQFQLAMHCLRRVSVHPFFSCGSAL